MSDMALDPVLGAGLVMLAGSLGAMAARVVRLPAACGAMAGGFAAGAATGGGGALDGGVLWAPLLAFLSFHLGLELEAAKVIRTARAGSLLIMAQTLFIFGPVWGACRLAGIDGGSALTMALASSAASPAALSAVRSESRARGVLTQQLLLATAASFVLASLGSGLPTGLLVGLCLLLPLSTLGTRASITALLGILLVIATVAPVRPGPGSLVTIPMIAGAVAGTLAARRELIREAARNLALPVAVVFFSLAGSRVAPGEFLTTGAWALVLVAIRATGLVVAGSVLRRVSDGLLQAGLIPMGGLLVVAPMLLGSDRHGGSPTLAAIQILAMAGALSEFLGMIATRWALVRSGEAAGLPEDPDAWRARMT